MPAAAAVLGAAPVAAGTTPEPQPDGAARYDDPEFQVDLALGLLPAADVSAYLRWDAERSELAVQACMGSAGFEYVPMIGDAAAALVDEVPEETAEERQRWGFGLLPAMDPANYEEGADTIEVLADPNAEVVDALDADQQALWFALQAECRDLDMLQSDPLNNPDVYELAVAAHEAIFSDPRVLAAEAGWAECMAAAGQPFADRAEMTVVLTDETMLGRFWSSEAWNESSPDHADFVVAVERERAAAVADLECTVAVEVAAREVAAEQRDHVLAQWDTIDWSKPPLGYGEDELGEFDQV